MRSDKLLALADLLDTLEPSQLVMEQWTCGTAACAIGWYCRALNPEVLVLRRSNIPGGYIPASRVTGMTDHDAIKEEFGIAYMESVRLFVGSNSLTPADVSSRIRRFVGQAAPPVAIEMKPARLVPVTSPADGGAV